MKEPYSSIPENAWNWVAQEDGDAFYDQESLHNYMDNEGELYSAYRFHTAFVRRYQNVDDPDEEIVLDVYDMGSSEEAFGIFSCEREDRDVGVGQGSEYGDGLLRFWKDHYFVSLVSLSDDDLESVMMEIATGVAEAIDTTGMRPALVERLPKEGLAENQIRYFHTMQCLNHHFFVSNENILTLDADTLSQRSWARFLDGCLYGASFCSSPLQSSKSSPEGQVLASTVATITKVVAVTATNQEGIISPTAKRAMNSSVEPGRCGWMYSFVTQTAVMK